MKTDYITHQSTIRQQEENTKHAIETLYLKIRRNNCLAWSLVFVGFLVAALGLYLIGTTYRPFSRFGALYVAIVAFLWCGAGLSLIRENFLGQKQQIKRQKLKILQCQWELENAKLEYEKQQQTMETHFQMLNKKRLEHTLNGWVDMLREIVDSSKILSANRRVAAKGKDSFKYWYDNLKKLIVTGKKVLPLAQALTKYQSLADQYPHELGNYFRVLYHLMEYVDSSDISQEDKTLYIQQVNMNLSSYERVLLFYHSLTKGKEHFKTLIEKYALLEQLETKLIFDVSHLKPYANKAYGAEAKA